ncbi:hypothetical protein Anas_09127 [Armadillidium nasatum]|uniref:Photolyase/cryptochrome alpha/beta domain-containing protein n=1 Tax=Armadillidium nasatum TaxID=96803 RepID=A0A5N5TC71_9CRUS|nr:hypothetical protein Anas_09127 [Armadillidium nasatum]
MTSKKQKVTLEESSKKIKLMDDTFIEKLESERNEVARSVTDFNFNKSRVRMLSKQLYIPENCDGIVYWMSREQRVQDNWVLLFAQRLALKHEMPLHIVFCLMPEFLDATFRHYDFLLKDSP